jgi:thioredoxin reductase
MGARDHIIVGSGIDALACAFHAGAGLGGPGYLLAGRL